jgi:hypothetical protein
MTGPAGAVAIWHDIASEGLDEFYAWHGEEHMPERVGIPGFVRGRRFVAIDASVAFFNLYETTSVAAVTGPDYRRRLDNPTPRSLSAVRHFRNVARSLCRVAFRAGRAQGGIVATLRYEVAEGREELHRSLMVGSVLPALAAGSGVAAVTLLEADAAASGYVNAEQRARGTANSVPPFVVVCEGWADDVSLTALMRSTFAPAACAMAAITTDPTMDVYRHQVTVEA